MGTAVDTTRVLIALLALPIGAVLFLLFGPLGLFVGGPVLAVVTTALWQYKRSIESRISDLERRVETLEAESDRDSSPSDDR